MWWSRRRQKESQLAAGLSLAHSILCTDFVGIGEKTKQTSARYDRHTRRILYPKKTPTSSVWSPQPTSLKVAKHDRKNNVFIIFLSCRHFARTATWQALIVIAPIVGCTCSCTLIRYRSSSPMEQANWLWFGAQSCQPYIARRREYAFHTKRRKRIWEESLIAIYVSAKWH